jgi:PhzF family phenazine biosynthesis protein
MLQKALLRFDEVARMELLFFQIDAFTSELFRGNPAAVVLLEKPLDARICQAIATENNLSETAFVHAGEGFYHLRWFTPKTEVDLCGHATLATAFVLFREKELATEEITFETASGTLRVRRSGEKLYMNFPTRPPSPVRMSEELVTALGKQPLEAFQARDLLVLFGSEKEVASLQPDFRLLGQLDAFAVCVTAQGDQCDFVSRFFAPKTGIPEDPVTGSAHCTLTPFWAQRLSKNELLARQVSKRGGELLCRLEGDRVTIGGCAVEYLRGKISI